MWVLLGDVVGQPEGEAEQFGVGDDVVDQPDAERGLGVYEIACQGDLAGPSGPDAGRELKEDGARKHPDADVGVGEHGTVRGNNEIARQGHLEAAGHRGSIDGGDDRDGRILDAGGDAREIGEPVDAQVAEVKPGAERRILSSEDDGAGVPAGVEGVADGRCESQVEGVARLGPAQGDDSNVAITLDPNGAVNHEVHLRPPPLLAGGRALLG